MIINNNRKEPISQYEKGFLISRIFIYIDLGIILLFLILRWILHKSYGIDFRTNFVMQFIKTKIAVSIFIFAAFLFTSNIYFHEIKESNLNNKYRFCIIAIVLIIALIGAVYRVSYDEVEEVYEEEYILVYKTGLSADGFRREYKVLNPVFRRRISEDYGLEELLEHRYGMKFIIGEEGGKVVITPEQYPQLKLKIYDPFICRIDFEDMLARWYFEKAYKEKDLQMEYVYFMGEMGVANNIFCPVIKKGSNYELYAKEIADLIISANSDPFFRNHEGKLKCFFEANGKIIDYYIFTFGNELNDGKGSFYENSANVLDAIDNYF